MDLWVEEQTSRMLLWKTKKSVQRILQMLLRNMQKIHRFRLFFIWITVRTLIPVKAAIEGGYTSVMIDGSSLPFDENVELTREVVKYAHERGVSVEGELGVLAGVERIMCSQLLLHIPIL